VASPPAGIPATPKLKTARIVQLQKDMLSE
jgi:hypothetical protein